MKPNTQKIKLSFKKTLKILGITTLIFIVVLVSIPLLFKSKIVEVLKRGINDNLEAVVDFQDVNLSLLRSFPKMNVRIKNLSIKGTEEFEDVYLLKTDQLALDLSILEFLRNNTRPNIYYIGLRNAELNIIVIDENTANYLIAKPSNDISEPLDFNLKLSKYEFSDTKILYLDNLRKTQIDIVGLNHIGRGNLSAVVYDLNTVSTAEQLSINYDGNTLIDKAKIYLDAKLNIDMNNMKFTFLENELKINDFPAKFDGFLQLAEDNVAMDITFSSPSTSFKDLLSVIPGAYTKNFDQVNATGNLAFSGFVKGIYSDTQASLPAFTMSLQIDNASLRYPNMPASLSGLFADVAIKAENPEYQDLSINISDFRFKLNGEPFSGKLKIENGIADAESTGEIKGRLNLKDWSKLMPAEGVTELSGIIEADLGFKAKKSDILNENYASVYFEGKATMEGFNYKATGLPEVSMKSGKIEASPARMKILANELKLGTSDINLNGEVIHPLAFLTPEKDAVVNFYISSTLLNLNEWMKEKPKEENDDFSINDYKINEFKKVNINANAKFNKILFGSHEIKDLIFKGKFGNDQFIAEEMSLILDGSAIKSRGKFSDFISYLTDNGTLRAEMEIMSNRFDANSFIVNSSETPTQENLLFEVPKRVTMKLSGKIDQLLYANMELKDAQGILIIDNGVLYMNNVKTNALGGNFKFNGTYDSNTEKPKFDFALDLREIKFAEAFRQMESFRAIMPIAEFIQGVFNTSLSMNGFLGQNMMPDLSTINASGMLETIHGNLHNFEPIIMIADKLGITQLRNINLENTKNWFEIKEGTLELKPTKLQIAKMDMSVQGLHRIGRDMDFTIMMHIPRSLLERSEITAVAEKGLALLEREAGRLGVNISQGDYIDLKLKLGGKIKNPTLVISPIGTSGKSVRDDIKNELDSKISQLKDTINIAIKEKEKELRDTIMTTIDKEVDKVKIQAEEKAKELAEKAKQETEKAILNQVENTSRQVLGDSIQNKTKEVIEEKKEDIMNKIKEFNPFGKRKSGG